MSLLQKKYSVFRIHLERLRKSRAAKATVDIIRLPRQIIHRRMPMKLKSKISCLMETIQQSLFPHLDECLPSPLTEPEKHLVKILELGQIEKFVPVSASRLRLGWPVKERESFARAFIAKAVLNQFFAAWIIEHSESVVMSSGVGPQQAIESISTCLDPPSALKICCLGPIKRLCYRLKL